MAAKKRQSGAKSTRRKKQPATPQLELGAVRKDVKQLGDDQPEPGTGPLDHYRAEVSIPLKLDGQLVSTVQLVVGFTPQDGAVVSYGVTDHRS